MRTLLLAGLMLGWVGVALGAEGPAPSPNEDALMADAAVVQKNIFLPAVPDEPPPPPNDPKPTQQAPEVGPVVPPGVQAVERPEDYQFVTGIVQTEDLIEVLIENRRTNQTFFLKQGDPLGDGKIVAIGKYSVTVEEWTNNREIGLGYSVSGKKDTLVPPPIVPILARGPGANQSNYAGQPQPEVTPGRRQWEQWTPEQRQEFLRRSEALQRQRQQEERRRQEAQQRAQEEARRRQQEEEQRRRDEERRRQGRGFGRRGSPPPS